MHDMLVELLCESEWVCVESSVEKGTYLKLKQNKLVFKSNWHHLRLQPINMLLYQQIAHF